MAGPPVVTPRQLIRALGRAGFFIHHIRGSHYYLRHHGKPGLLVTVPHHRRDLKQGTLRAIMRQAGLSSEQLADLL